MYTVTLIGENNIKYKGGISYGQTEESGKKGNFTNGKTVTKRLRRTYILYYRGTVYNKFKGLPNCKLNQITESFV